jgi:hypothetical protein
VGVVLTHHSHPMAYHSETLSYVIHKYHTYEKKMYSIVKLCFQWRNYILGKETIIHTDHKLPQFMQTQGKLQHDLHHKWSTYFQQFHINVKYKTRSTNRFIYFLSRPPVMTVTIVLKSYKHDTYRWTHLYETNPNFSNTYQMLGAITTLTNFHLWDRMMLHLGHICIPSSE